MRPSIKKVLSEPYVHFLLAGAVIYFWFAISPGKQMSRKPRKEVTLTLSRQKQIRERFAQEWHRQPGAEEFALLSDDALLEEMLIDEALTLRLEREDGVIRRRLLKKMHFILEDSRSLKEPDEQELRNYYRKHREDYRDPKRLHFFQIYAPFGKESALEKMRYLLDLNDTPPADAPLFGEKSPGGNEIRSMDIDSVERRFGHYFAQRVVQLPSREWEGPIRSTQGVHIVYLLDKEGGRYLPFDEVEDRVYRDLLQRRRREKRKQSLRTVEQSFRKRIE